MMPTTPFTSSVFTEKFVAMSSAFVVVDVAEVAKLCYCRTIAWQIAVAVGPSSSRYDYDTRPILWHFNAMSVTAPMMVSRCHLKREVQ